VKASLFLIQSPQADLFCDGAGNYVPLAQAKRYDRATASDIMGGGLLPGEKMRVAPVPGFTKGPLK
jgi:hypothetical protein